MAATEIASQREAATASDDLDNIDPFTFKPPFTLCDKILIAINALWLLPIRLFFFLIPSIILGTIVCASSTFCEPYDPDNPVPPARWRRKFGNLLAPLCGRVFLFAFGFNWIHYKGRPAKTKEAPIIILAPHSSLLDVFAVSLYGVPTFVAREDMRRMLLFGPILTKALRTIYVNRDDTDSKMKAAHEIQRRALSGGVWPKVLLFPEGTTHNRKLLISFKKGAFLPKLPVQPFLIRYGNRLSTTTWGRTGWNQLIGLFYTLCQFHNSLELEFLDAYKPSEEEKSDAQLYARNVQLLVSKKLGVPTGVQSVEDNFFMSQAEKLGLPFISGLILYNRLSRETGIGFSEIRSCLTRFAAIDKDKDGWITPEDVASYLSVPNDTCLRTLFWTTDKASEGKLNFKQYLYGFVGRAKPFLRDGTFLMSVFNFFDKDGDGSIRRSDIFPVLPTGNLPHLKPAQVRRRKQSGGKKEEEESNHLINQAPGDAEDTADNMDFDQFKLMLEMYPEYLLLFHERENAGLSSSAALSAPLDIGSSTQKQHKVVIEVKEVAEPCVTIKKV